MPTIDNRTNREPNRTAAGFARTALLAVLVLLNVFAFMLALLGAAPTAHAAGPSLDIVVPRPSAANVASGPVGANISVTGSGQAGHRYKLSYATQDTTCASALGSQDLQITVTAQKDGTFSATFQWPSSTVDASYYVCAQDQTTLPVGAVPIPPIQSNQLYKVLDALPPSITVDVVSSDVNATPVPTPTTGGYYASSQVQITGYHFVPGGPGGSGGTTLEAFVTSDTAFKSSDARTWHPLPLANGSTTFTAESTGSFVKIVTLPTVPLGKVYLHVVSVAVDPNSNFPPALDAEQPIQLAGPLPTATPSTPTPNTTVTASPSATGTTGGNNSSNSSGPDLPKVLAVIGLSGLSIILFVIGISLMTSASTLPRAQR